MKEELEKLQTEKVITEVRQDVEVKIKKTKADTKEQQISLVEKNNDDFTECVNRLS